MATTKIWAVKTDVRVVIDYAENPEKTVREVNYVTVTESGEEIKIHSISEVIDYATRKDKTVKKEGSEIKEFVTGINCNKDTAFNEMMLTKLQFAKTDKILAWHGYQSFKPGEVTPEQAHEIGVKLAEKLWGDRFQVVVTTHLDRAHIHNHFVLNSVSFLDGKKFYGNRASYFNMREESDLLCREYGLSVIENPSYNGLNRSEYRARKNGGMTKLDVIREDIERVVSSSVSMPDFFRRMKLAGYKAYVRGSSLSVIPYGREKPIRISRHFPEFKPEAIEASIMENREKGKYGSGTFRNFKAGNVKIPQRKLKGYKALYYRYMYMLGVIPDRKRQYKGMHYLIRQDMIYLHKLRNEWEFIRSNDIKTTADLERLKKEKTEEYSRLSGLRKQLQNKIRRASPDERTELKNKLAALNDEIGKVRKDIYYIKDVQERSVTMKEKIKTVTEIYSEKSGNEKKTEQKKEGEIGI